MAAPSVALNHVQLDVGTLAADVLAPVVTNIQAVTKPLAPIVGFLKTPIPIVSQLNGHDVSFASILNSVGT